MLLTTKSTLTFTVLALPQSVHLFVLSLFLREVEEELEVVWQAATRENHQIKEALLDSRLTADLHSLALSCSASPGWPYRAPDGTTSSVQNQPHSSGPAPFTSDQSPGLQRKYIFISDSDHRNNSSDEKHKHGLDFYC